MSNERAHIELPIRHEHSFPLLHVISPTLCSVEIDGVYNSPATNCWLWLSLLILTHCQRWLIADSDWCLTWYRNKEILLTCPLTRKNCQKSICFKIRLKTLKWKPRWSKASMQILASSTKFSLHMIMLRNLLSWPFRMLGPTLADTALETCIYWTMGNPW